MSARMNEKELTNPDLSLDGQHTQVLDPAQADSTLVIPQNQQQMEEQANTDVRLGSTLKNRFILESVIARGGMGVVYKARDLRKVEAMDRDPYVAIKLLNRQFRTRKKAFISLQRETRKTQTLSHPNIVNVHDFDRDGDIFMMTMEYLKGQSLFDRMKSNGKGKPLPKGEGLRIIESIGNALVYAHSRDIVHCDLKPANIFITDDNAVKILDFGIARAIQDNEESEQGGLTALTPTYASCEMLDREVPEARDDLFALGCLCYEMLTGFHPYKRKPATEARDKQMKLEPVPGLNGRQWKALASALAFERAQRPGSVKEFLQAILPERKTGFLGSPLSYMLGIGVLLASVIITQWTFSPDRHPPEVMAVPFSSLSQADQESVLSLLEIADAHMTVNRYTEPAGSNAYMAYQQVLKIHPGNPQAMTGLSKIADVYARLAQEYMTKGDKQTAINLIEEGLKISPYHEGLTRLQDRI